MKQNRTALTALIVACTIWGMSVALSKLALGWLDPSWLAALRFLVVVPVLLWFARGTLRRAVSPVVIGIGLLNYGVVVLLQNFGVAHTSVTHAAIIIGAIPGLTAIFAVGLGHKRPTALAWLGFLISTIGIVVVAQGRGGGAHTSGDLIMLGSVALSALGVALQPFALRGRDATSVTAVQFLAGGLFSVPIALLTHGLPSAPTHSGPVVAFVVLAVLATLLPFWLFNYGQAHIAPDVAGAITNVEPLVGAIIGWVAFSNPFDAWQLLGVFTVIVGITLSVVPRKHLAALIDLPWRRAFASE